MTAELLRRAADRIEQLAAEAKPGPWIRDTGIDHQGGEVLLVSSANVTDQFPVVAEMGGTAVIDQRNAAWIATLGPQVAAPLAAWLREEAHLGPLYQIDGQNRDPDFPSPAVQLARAILGEEPA